MRVVLLNNTTSTRKQAYLRVSGEGGDRGLALGPSLQCPRPPPWQTGVLSWRPSTALVSQSSGPLVSALHTGVGPRQMTLWIALVPLHNHMPATIFQVAQEASLAPAREVKGLLTGSEDHSAVLVGGWCTKYLPGLHCHQYMSTICNQLIDVLNCF